MVIENLEKSRKGHGKIFCQVCVNPELRKYIADTYLNT